MNEEMTKNDSSLSRDYGQLENLLGRIFDGIRKYFIVFIASLIVISGISTIYMKASFVPKYTSTADFVINISSDYGESNKYFNITTTKLLAKTFPYIISSGMLNSVIENEVGVDSKDFEITAAAEGDTNLFTLSVTAYDPDTAYKVLQSAIANYPGIAEFVVGDTNFTLIDESGINDNPVNSVSYGLAALIGAGASAAIYALLIGLFVVTHKTVRITSDIKRILNIQHLATVPMVEFKKSKVNTNKNILIGSDKISAHFKESIALVKTRLERSEPGKTILITSAMPTEGKTTISVNLAISLAMEGKKVVLIDCDLRNPSILKQLGISKPLNGIADYLNEKVPLNKVGFRMKEYNNLVVIPGGTPCRNPSELVSDKHMKTLIDQLAPAADFIILDATPCSMLSDAAALAQYADSAVYVIRQDFSSTDRITDGIDILNASGIKIVGCILNMAEYGSLRYGYSSYYGRYGKYGYGRYANGGYSGKYGYGYGHGYGSKTSGSGAYGAYGDDAPETLSADKEEIITK